MNRPEATLAAVQRQADSHRLRGSWIGVKAANAFLAHLESRAFSPATVRAYAFDLLNFARFLQERAIQVPGVVPTDVFDWIDWQSVRRPGREKVVTITAGRGSAPTSVNRRVAAVRAFFEHQVMSGARADNPVPSPRGAKACDQRSGVRSVTSGQGECARAVGWSDLRTHRDRAIVLLMVFGGLRAAEVRSLLLADADQGRRWVRVVGKSGRERTVPVDQSFFTELAAYLRTERPPGLKTRECFVVLQGPTAGRAMTEAGMRSVFRYHRHTSGATRVRPHRLRHTYGTELAAAGIDLLVLRELMGHASPETTAGYVHLSTEHVAAEYAAARAVLGR
ncbi:MAG: tyrosine-type recombinase/integrase [Actinomycetota bacterium]